MLDKKIKDDVIFELEDHGLTFFNLPSKGRVFLWYGPALETDLLSEVSASGLLGQKLRRYKRQMAFE